MKESIVQIVSIFSLLSSLLILLLFYFKPLLIKKKINQILLLISLCDMLSTIGWIIGESYDNTFKCWLQSMITSYFPLVSLFLTTLIAFILFAVIYKKTWTLLYSRYTHLFCWGVPFILTILPLTTNSYGNPGSDRGWCFLDRSHSHKWTLAFWIFFSFYMWFYIAVFLYFMLLWSITYRLSFVYGTLARIQNRSEVLTIIRIKRSIRKFIWYPLIILVCWLPSALWDINEALDESGGKLQAFMNRDWNNSFFNVFPASQGLCTSIAFLLTNREVHQLILGNSQTNQNDDEVDQGYLSNHSMWPFFRDNLLSQSLSSPLYPTSLNNNNNNSNNDNKYNNNLNNNNNNNNNNYNNNRFFQDASSSSYRDDSDTSNGNRGDEGDIEEPFQQPHSHRTRSFLNDTNTVNSSSTSGHTSLSYSQYHTTSSTQENDRIETLSYVENNLQQINHDLSFN